MNDWYQCMVDALQLNGKGERTQQAYTRAVRMLSQFYDKSPDLISEQELQEYFLQRKNVNHWSPKIMRICYCGIRFFYEKVLRTLALEAMEFIRRFLQHVLPTGFMKVRYYGFLNPDCTISLDRVRALIEKTCGFNLSTLPKAAFQPIRPTCPSCGAPLRLTKASFGLRGSFATIPMQPTARVWCEPCGKQTVLERLVQDDGHSCIGGHKLPAKR